MVSRFSKEVISQEGGQLEDWLSEFSPKQNSKNLYPIYNLKSGLLIPETLPIFLYVISAGNVRDVLLDRLIVLSFINWNKVKALFEERGAIFSWSTKKEARREKAKNIFLRSLLIGNRIPLITKNDINLNLGPGVIARIIFDGIRPRCVIEQQIECLDLLKKEGIRKKLPK